MKNPIWMMTIGYDIVLYFQKKRKEGKTLILFFHKSYSIKLNIIKTTYGYSNNQ